MMRQLMRQLMRRILCLGLFLVLLMVGMASLAEEGQSADFFLTQLIAQEEGYGNIDYPMGAVSVGDVLYILTDKALHTWRRGMEQPEKLLTFPQMELDGQEEDARSLQLETTPDPIAEMGEMLRHYSSKLFTDGMRLLALRMEQGEIWQVTDEAGALAPRMETALDFSAFRNQEGDFGYPDIKDIELLEGHLYLVAVNYEKSDTPILYRWEIATGKVGQELACQIVSMAPYREGKFLCILVDQTAWEDNEAPQARLAVLDPKTDAFEERFPLGSYNCIGLVYNPENDTAYFMEDSLAYSLPGVVQPAKKSAYFINRTWENLGCGLLQGGWYYQCSSDGVSVRQLDMPGVENGALTIYGVYGNPAHLAFSTRYPQIPTALMNEYYDSLEAFANAIVSGQDAADVLQLYSSGAPIRQLIDKGYAMDLSGNADIMAAVEGMYPALVDSYRRDGKVFGLPLNIYASSIGYNKSALQELGLTREDLPTTWIELMDFIANWQEDYGEDNPGVHLMDNMGVKDSLLDSLMESYAAYSLKTWGRIDFDTPLFHKLMTAYDAIDGDQFPQPQGEEEEEFWNAKHLLTLYAGYTDLQYSMRQDEWYMTPLPLPLDEGLELVIAASGEVMIINPRTTRPEQALLYVANAARNYDKRSSLITLFPGNNDPVPNQSFEEDLASWEKTLARIRKQLETASPEERPDLLDSEKYMSELISKAENYRWDVWAESIAWYREAIAPYLYLVGQTPLNTWKQGKENELYSLMQQYKEGAIPLERFIREIAGRVRMMELENQ